MSPATTTERVGPSPRGGADGVEHGPHEARAADAADATVQVAVAVALAADGSTAVPSAAGVVEDLWSSYRAGATREVRDKLIVTYAPLVKYVAGRVLSGLRPSVDQGDLVSYGIFGLIDAIDKYDPARNVKFETYAITRIRGAIIDELRAIDWVPRSVRAKARAVEKAYATLESRLMRTPSDAEVAAELGMSERDLQNLFAKITFVGPAALDEVLSSGTQGDEWMTLGDTVPDRNEGPGEVFESEEQKQILAAALNRLDDREKVVLTLYYYESLTLAEIGDILGVTESRVCQIHTKAILQLRSRMLAAQRDPR